ncbi:hypothetical protein N0V90_007858 [Kalmusia sp. IMI 367209]|nr:hypothetical protein N0V90_007858 [Kalmusia sp. IMI 367209]
MSRAMTTSTYASVETANVLQGLGIHGGHNVFTFTQQESSRAGLHDSSSNVHWKVPRRTNTLFTGRREVVDRVKKALQDGSQQDGVFVISGLGGSGKSEICLKIANELRSEFWAVLWVDVSSPDMAESDFIVVAEMLGHKADSVEQACRLISNTKKRCLLILDNADDPQYDYNAYLPSGCEALADLDPADCKELLLKAAGISRDRWEVEGRAAEDVVRLVHSHTLALIQAGAYVSRCYCKLEDYPKKFQQQRTKLLKFSPVQARSRYRDVYATFEASAEALSANALNLLGVVSALNYTFLPESLFESAWIGSQEANKRVLNIGPELGDISSWDVSAPEIPGSEIGLDVLNKWHASQLPAVINTQVTKWNADHLYEAIHLLESLSLVTRTEQDGASGISLHALVHAWARDRQTVEARKASWLAAGCVFTLAVLGSPGRAIVDYALLSHIQAWADEMIMGNISCDTHRNLIALVWSCSWLLDQMRDDSRLDRLLQALFWGAGLDPTQPQGSLVSLYHLYARSQNFNGNGGKTVDLMEQVVAIRRETLDERHANRLAAEVFLAISYDKNRQIREAIEMLKHVVKVQSPLPDTHPAKLASQHALAVSYNSDKQFQKAIDLLEHVVKMKSTMLAKTHPERLLSQHELGNAYLKQGKVQEAVELLEHVVKIESITLAETHPERLASQHALGRAYLEQCLVASRAARARSQD